jgi:C-terminal processing protease CtpA/Prc
LSLKIWSGNTSLEDDTVAIAANLVRKDTVLKRGIVLKKINGQSISSIIDTLNQFISSDGYNLTHKYQSLSNRGGFGSAYTAVFGIKENYFVDYVDNAGKEKSTTLSAYSPKADSSIRTAIARFEKTSRSERKKQIRNATRNFRIDTLNKTGIMELGSFGRHLKLSSFFKSSFKKLRRSDASSLVLDVRGNGGGSVSNSTLLTKFISDKNFKVADSLYANSRKSHYRKYIENDFSYKLFMTFFTAKKKDGKYHFGYYERHYFNPKRKNHFDGKVYILTGGNSFSATAIFAQAVRDQSNVILVGEETGGGAYGNSAWLIPDVTLPETGVRFRLPLFRLVINKNIPKNGRGVQPEVEAKPTVDAIRRGVDYKMDKVMQLIRGNQ